MTISISVKDANKDGKGINFDAYMKLFDKKYHDADGRGDFNGKVVDPTAEEHMHAPGYATSAKENGGGQSVLFGGPSNFYYSLFDEHNGAQHVVYGELSSITFGNNTKVTELKSGDGNKYTNNGEIKISGFTPFESTSQSGELLGDIKDGKIASLMTFLKSDSIDFNGSNGNDVFKGYGFGDDLNGGRGNDKLNGGAGDDHIVGGRGNDVLTGGTGADTFDFSKNHGNDRITDFGNGDDVIDFKGQFADYDAVLDAATESSKGVTIVYSGGQVLLQGVDLDDLGAADFGF